MSGQTSIEWTDRTWNPVRGCSRVSEGCRNCYAERIAARFSGSDQPFHGFARMGSKRNTLGLQVPSWTGRVELIPEKLDEPLRWRKPQRIFVNSMSDLFHENLSFEDMDRVFGVMASARHTFQILTKRPERMLAYLTQHAPGGLHIWKAAQSVRAPYPYKPETGWPLPNVQLGVSVEDQATADERIPLLLQTPAVVRSVSYEPALGPVNFDHFIAPDPPPRIDWLIIGGESGPGARPCDVAWIRSAVRQCREAGVACFVKQFGAYRISADPCSSVDDHLDWIRDRKGANPSEWPEDLRVREFPKTS